MFRSYTNYNVVCDFELHNLPPDGDSTSVGNRNQDMRRPTYLHNLPPEGEPTTVGNRNQDMRRQLAAERAAEAGNSKAGTVRKSIPEGTDTVQNIISKESPQECAIYIKEPPFMPKSIYSPPNEEMQPVDAKNLLLTCRKISKRQPITHLWLRNTKGEDLANENDVFNLSMHAQSLRVQRFDFHEGIWAHLLQQVSRCEHLLVLDLAENRRGEESGQDLMKCISSWGDYPSLQVLDLDAWRMPADVCEDVMQVVATCKHLTHLNLSRNTLNEAGRYLIELIQSQGIESPLQMLKLDFCPMPDHLWCELLQVISSCEHLNHLWLSANTLTGCLPHFLSRDFLSRDPTRCLPCLEELQLCRDELSKEDLQHLTYLLQAQKLPQLRRLRLLDNDLGKPEIGKAKVDKLIEALVSHHQRELHLELYGNWLSRKFKQKGHQRCRSSFVNLKF